MRGRRALLVVLVVVVTLVVVAVLVYTRLVNPPNGPAPEEVATPTPLPAVEVLVSAQDPIPRGWQFEHNDGAVSIQQWPEGSVPPPGSYASEDQIAYMYAAQNIPMGAPILKSMLSESAIAPFPEGRVATAFRWICRAVSDGISRRAITSMLSLLFNSLGWTLSSRANCPICTKSYPILP